MLESRKYTYRRNADMRVLLAVLIALAANAGAQAAEPFPSHSLRMIVPFLPAGIADPSARLVAEGLRGKLGQTVARIYRTNMPIRLLRVRPDSSTE
jgi:tripartite-type tricarboxylate transporter receptor subunit TctC